MLEHRQVAADFALGNAVVVPCMWPARCAITWAASGCDCGRALAGIHDLFKARGTFRGPGEALPGPPGVLGRPREGLSRLPGLDEIMIC